MVLLMKIAYSDGALMDGSCINFALLLWCCSDGALMSTSMVL
jgi:hypothetical protein